MYVYIDDVAFTVAAALADVHWVGTRTTPARWWWCTTPVRERLFTAGSTATIQTAVVPQYSGREGGLHMSPLQSAPPALHSQGWAPAGTAKLGHVREPCCHMHASAARPAVTGANEHVRSATQPWEAGVHSDQSLHTAQAERSSSPGTLDVWRGQVRVLPQFEPVTAITLTASGASRTLNFFFRWAVV